MRDIWHFVLAIDLAPLLDRIKSRQGHPGQPSHPTIDPAIFVALWLWAAIDGVGSIQRLARLCREHDVYRWPVPERSPPRSTGCASRRTWVPILGMRPRRGLVADAFDASDGAPWWALVGLVVAGFAVAERLWMPGSHVIASMLGCTALAVVIDWPLGMQRIVETAALLVFGAVIGQEVAAGPGGGHGRVAGASLVHAYPVPVHRRRGAGRAPALLLGETGGHG